MNKRKRKKEMLKKVIKFYLDNGDFSMKLSRTARKKIVRNFINYVKNRPSYATSFLGSPLSKPVGILSV